MYGGVSVCCVWYSLEQVWGSECAAGGFVMCVCAACVAVWSNFGGVSVQQVALWCLCVCVLRMGHYGTGVVV